MTNVTREEVSARLEASEARVATAIAEMRVENARFLGELSAFKSDLGATVGKLESSLTTHSHAIESKLSGLKVWVLSGALAGVLALLTVVVSGVVRYATSNMQYSNEAQRRSQVVHSDPAPVAQQADPGLHPEQSPAPKQPPAN